MASEPYNFDFLETYTNSELEKMLKDINDKQNNLFQSTLLEFDPRPLTDEERKYSIYINHLKLAIQGLLMSRSVRRDKAMVKLSTFDGGKRKTRKSRGRRRGAHKSRRRRGGAPKSRRRRSTRRRR